MIKGISTACFKTIRETEDALASIKSLGADCAEVNLRTFYEYRPEFAKKYADLKGDAGVVAVRPLHANFEPQLLSDSRRVRGDGYYWLDQIMRSAQLFGAKDYCFQGCLCGAENFDLWRSSGYIRGVIEFCSRYGLGVCIENSAQLCGNPYIFGKLKNELPELGFIFDLAAARASGYPYQMFLKGAAGSVAYARLSDLDENGKICLPGEGITDFSEVVKCLRGADFDGAIIIDAPTDGDGRLTRSLDYLAEIIDKV